MDSLYSSKAWKSLGTISRAQLLLVHEGLKRGTIIHGNHTSFFDVLNKTGLSYSLNSDKYRLQPAFTVAKSDDLKNYFHKHLTLPDTATGADFHRIAGWLLGYPDCCTEEYVKKRTPQQVAAPHHLQYTFGQELDELIRTEGTYPDILDYRPPSFTPCSVTCSAATDLLTSWKEAIDYFDIEAGRALVSYNRQSFPERLAHTSCLESKFYK